MILILDPDPPADYSVRFLPPSYIMRTYNIVGPGNFCFTFLCF